MWSSVEWSWRIVPLVILVDPRLATTFPSVLLIHSSSVTSCLTWMTPLSTIELAGTLSPWPLQSIRVSTILPTSLEADSSSRAASLTWMRPLNSEFLDRMKRNHEAYVAANENGGEWAWHLIYPMHLITCLWERVDTVPREAHTVSKTNDD